jgi:hypothetical protein
MDLKENLLTAFAPLPGARVPYTRQVNARWIVYVVSPAFAGVERPARHQLLHELLSAPDSPLTAEERRSIVLVRPFTPKELRALVRANRARKQKRKPTEPA